MHVARLSTLKPAGREWADEFGAPGWREMIDAEGDPVPKRLDALPDFRTDWPGVSGIRRNAAALAEIDLPHSVLRDVYAGNAATAFGGLDI